MRYNIRITTDRSISMELRKALPQDFDSVKRFYWELIDDMQGCKTFPKWSKGEYPSDDDLAKYIENGELYIAQSNGEIAGAFALNNCAPKGYESCDWLVKAPPEQVSVIHILAVSAKQHHTGIGSYLVEQAKEICRKTGQRSLRLDVVDNNTPARNLYVKQGFIPHKIIELTYDNVGTLKFLLCEYPVK